MGNQEQSIPGSEYIVDLDSCQSVHSCPCKCLHLLSVCLCHSLL